MGYTEYCNVVVNTRTRATDRLYTYQIPNSFIGKVKIGDKVIVPFGQGNKLLEGFVLEVNSNDDIQNIKGIKAIKDVLYDDINLSKKQIELCRWMRKTYLCSYYEAIQCLIPRGTTLKKKKVYKINEAALDSINISKDYYNDNNQIIKVLLDNGSITQKELTKKLGYDCSKELNKLLKNNIIEMKEKFYSDISIKYKRVAKINFNSDEIDEVIAGLHKRAFKQVQVLKYIARKKKIELSKLIEDTKTSRAVINSLIKKNFIKISNEIDYRTPFDIDDIKKDKPKELNNEQQRVYRDIINSIKKKAYETFLLHGVTGSGKTEVYMQLVDYVISNNQQAIILVPEISLTPQIVDKFLKRFGNNVAVLHSKLSLGERYDQWKKIKNNEISIVIGARSAIFAPCNNLGLVIIDEEHESSYKSEMNPKYHTIDVAKYLCRANNAVLVMGTATPSIESYYKAKNGSYKLLELKKRFNKNPLPKVEVIDMRIELEEGNKGIFSRKLYSLMKNSLLDDKQVILFLNRRGYSTFVSCRSCGYVLKCPNCDISLTYHQKDNIAKCHYCGHKSVVPRICPECKSKYIKFFGLGTEKVEEYVNKLFPSYRTGRLDIDTTSKKGSLEKIIEAFEKKEIHILIGTQMVTKGLDFPYVTLVGVLSADITLNLPDYRANERTFQLLTQVAGRAGRHDFKGNVIIQTYSPNNYAINASQKHDYEEFYDREIGLRKEFSYPPFYNIINVIILGKNEMAVIKSANRLFQKIQGTIIKDKSLNNVQLLGPNPAILGRIKGNYRWQILLKYQSVDHENIKSIINNICNINKSRYIENNVGLIFDMKPYSIF
ncbi:primosomal protein N' [Paramaledivibacter caminithermalis]|uniref:Replication restart protein PriA n=1 Tax=Paramaledivibacter caminithermalis (strain DSM 15212 / CIP 107654 / DViRD3) TaxID=1121301 RepID=A0A1M6NHD7_PARC5|nr:primosomal protein N' [Paramaledivibacter caminithermalis]SHJ95052.1 replication restart DNA helicase PriA [Paramaledivibacter caminithermalis DSM 15212]